MKDGEDIDHAEIVDELSGLETHPGFRHLVAKHNEEVQALLERMLSAPDCELAKAREAHRTASRLSPAETLQTLKQSHRSAAAKQAPRVPKPKR